MKVVFFSPLFFVCGCILFSLHGKVTFELAEYEMLDVVLLIFL